MDEIFNRSVEEIWSFWEEIQVKYKNLHEGSSIIGFQISMLCRLLLSSLIYGDRKDTIEFMAGKKKVKYDFSWEDQLNFFEEKYANLRTDSYINRVRADISRQCFDFAEKGTGIYTLNVPTGGGKTLCTLRYALAHAKKYHKKRIIFVIPLLSILDQNSKVIKEYIKDQEIVMEHHSDIVRERSEGNELDNYELFTVTWDSPIIITTMVQLLNILFSGETSAIGRMQALCDSIIVIDEIQSLPQKTIMMFNMAINFLKNFCNATVVLSSATQPCLNEIRWPVEYSNPGMMVKLSKDQMTAFQRTKIIDKTVPDISLNECGEFCNNILKEVTSLLVICNTKKQALTLYQYIQEKENIKVYHLSTSMCKAHRVEVLRQLTKDLNESKQQGGKKVFCVSTQLVEAGVDFSFESVVRMMAGIDNLAQAAGRCNRNGEFGKLCNVYLVKINNKDENLSYLQEIKKAKDSTQAVLYCTDSDVKNELIGEKAVDYFYKSLFANKDSQNGQNELSYIVKIKELNSEISLAYLLGNKNNTEKVNIDINKQFLLRQPFMFVGREFKVFDQLTTDILVPYKDGEKYIEDLLEKIKHLNGFSDALELLDQLKNYSVSIYEWQKRYLEESGMLISYADGKINILNQSAYQEDVGLIIEKEYSIENLIY